MAAASDPQAQRWLGWSAKDVAAEEGLERLISRMPGPEKWRGS